MDRGKGLPEVVDAMFPKTLTHLCIVHLVRASLRYVSSTDSKAVAAALKAIYLPVSHGRGNRKRTGRSRGGVGHAKYNAVVRLWRGNWDNIIPFFQFPSEIRKVIYTTNAIKSWKQALQSFQVMFGEERVSQPAL
jgi:putative transposase